MKWLHGLGRVYNFQARFPEAIAAFTEVLEMARLENSKLGQAYAYWGLSFSQFESGDTQSAFANSKNTVALASDEDLVPSKQADFLLGVGLYRQCRALISMGRFEEAILLAEEAEKTLSSRGSDNAFFHQNNLHILALGNMFLGRFKKAQEFEKRELAISRDMGDLKSAGNGLNSLGFQSYLQGDPTKAIAYFEEALPIARDVGNKAGEIMILSNIYGSKVLLGEYAYCEAQLRSLIDEIGDKGHFLVSEMYRFLAEALIGQGKNEDGLEKAKRSLTLAEETDNQEAIGEAWRLLGVAASCLREEIVVNKEKLSADECFQKSLDIYERLGMEANFALALRNLGHHKRTIGDHAKADELLALESEISTRLEIDTAAKCPYFGS